jgi:hypothetical protein
MNIMRCQPVADLPGQYNLQDIRSQHPGKTGNKNDNPLLNGMINDSR